MNIPSLFAAALLPKVVYCAHEYFETNGERRLEVQFWVPALNKPGVVGCVCPTDADILSAVEQCARLATEWAEIKIHKAKSNG